MRGVNTRIRDALRQAGAEAGRKARVDAGLPEPIEDLEALQRLAEMLIKAAGRRDVAEKNLGGAPTCRWGIGRKNPTHGRRTGSLTPRPC